MYAIEKISAVQQVEDRIKQYILSDTVKIGDKLPAEKTLCEELMVGRGTVREAIRLLQAKGYVEVLPGRGAFVAQKEESGSQGLAQWFQENEIEIKDFIEVRMAIEPLAVKLAVQRCSDKDIQRLREIHEETIRAAQKQDSAELALCDERFHTCLVECSHNKLLSSINKEIVKSLVKFRGRTFLISGNIENCIPSHSAILEAFEKRDVKMAEKSLKTHLDRVYSDLEKSKTV